MNVGILWETVISANDFHFLFIIIKSLAFCFLIDVSIGMPSMHKMMYHMQSFSNVSYVSTHVKVNCKVCSKCCLLWLNKSENHWVIQTFTLRVNDANWTSAENMKQTHY